MRTMSPIFSQQAGFGMPTFGRVASLCAAPTTGAVSVAAAGSKSVIDDAAVSGYRHTATTVLEDVFPGPSAWSPPI